MQASAKASADPSAFASSLQLDNSVQQVQSCPAGFFSGLTTDLHPEFTMWQHCVCGYVQLRHYMKHNSAFQD